MANEIYLPGNILSMAAEAADRLVKQANGDAALLYLYLLRSGGEYHVAGAVRALHWEPGRCDEAFRALVDLKLARPQASQPARRESELPAPEYSAEDIAKEIEGGSSPFAALVTHAQNLLGKPLSTADLKSLYTIYDYSGLPPEVIMTLLQWCVDEHQRKYGPARFPRLPQIQREAMRWRERGIDTMEVAEAYMKRQRQLQERSVEILALLDIRGRQPVTKEREYMAGWVDMGFEDEALRMAYERTVLQKQGMNWAYMNSILKSWHQKGLHTVEQITAGDSQGVRRSLPGAGATAPQPAAPGEADRRAREDMEQLRRLLQQSREEAK